MRKLCLVTIIAGLLAGSNLYAAMVTLTAAGGNANGGGLFTAHTTDNGTFNTFCISVGTHFSYSGSYSYEMSSTIIASDIPPAFPYITEGTAYIYHQFLSGNAAYGANLDGATLNNVQAAIWFLQGTGGSLGVNNGIISQAIVDSHLSLDQLKANGNGDFGVVAMNMWNANGIAQPQLGVVPEPTTMIAGALLLLPFGASAVRILRRRT